MADKPWSKQKLTPGQIRQAFVQIGCTELSPLAQDAAAWRAPTGRVFTVSYEDADAAWLEGIIATIEEWVEEHRKGRG